MTTTEARASRSIRTAAACFLLLAGACTRSFEERGEPPDSGAPAPGVVGDGGMGDPDGALGTPGATPGEVDAVSALCGLDEGGVEPIPDMEALTSHLVGRWLWCSGVRLFSREDVSGIRIDADRTWKFLLPGPDGGLVEGGGFDNGGTWAVIDLGEANGATRFQVNIESTGIGGLAAFPYFATAPAKVRLSTMVGVCDYASLDAR